MLAFLQFALSLTLQDLFYSTSMNWFLCAGCMLFCEILNWAMLKTGFKGTATDTRYSARSKFSRSLVHRKNLTLICQVVFTLQYVFRQESYNTSFEFEWTRRKVATDNNSRWICKQAIIKLSLAHSFRKMFLIGQNSKQAHMTYSFLELLIFFR